MIFLRLVFAVVCVCDCPYNTLELAKPESQVATGTPFLTHAMCRGRDVRRYSLCESLSDTSVRTMR